MDTKDLEDLLPDLETVVALIAESNKKCEEKQAYHDKYPTWAGPRSIGGIPQEHTKTDKELIIETVENGEKTLTELLRDKSLVVLTPPTMEEIEAMADSIVKKGSAPSSIIDIHLDPF